MYILNNLTIQAIVYEFFAFVILFILTLIWYGRDGLTDTVQFAIVSSILLVVYYEIFHRVLAAYKNVKIESY